MRTCIWLGLLLFVAPLQVMEARASSEPVCRSYDRSSVKVPAAAKKYLSQGMALRVCSPPEGEREYFVQSKPWRAHMDVCHFEERRLYPVGDALKPGDFRETETPGDALIRVQTLMAPIGSACPDQNDPRYIPVSGVSEGVFLHLVRLWDRISESTKTLDAACSVTPRTDNQARAFSILRGLVESHSGNLVRVFLPPIESEAGGPIKYELTIDDTNSDHFSYISFDLIDGQFCIAKVDWGMQ